MPRKDGTGPLGQGVMTGGGLGLCNADKIAPIGYGFGGGFGRGNCRRMILAGYNSKEALTQQKAALESRLDAINKQLDK